MVAFYNAIFYQPIFNALIFLHNVLPGHDIGLAIIFLTIVIKLILWPFQTRMLRSQKALSDIQPRIEALKKQYGTDKEGLGKAVMELYSKEKVNPASSCLPTLIQLPVFIALYQSLSHGLKSSGFDLLYPFVANPGTIQPTLLGFLNLSTPSIVLALLAGVAQYFQAKMMVTRQQAANTNGAKDEAMLATMNKQMLYMMPVVTVFIGWKLPAGLSLYWCLSNVLTIAQQYWFFKKKAAADAVPAAPAKM